MGNFVLTPIGVVTFPTSLTTTTILVRGATFTFDRPMPVGYTIGGDPVVFATEAFSITDDFPASEVDPTYVGNGMMEFEGDGSNAPTSDSSQGFDASLDPGGADPGSLGSGSAIPYSAALNVAPSLAGNGPIAVAQGARKTFVKAVSGSQAASTAINDYVVLTVLPEAPAKATLFRPGAVFANQSLSGREDIDLSCLRSLTPPAGIPSVQTALDNLGRTAAARMFPEWKPNKQRRIEDAATRNIPGVTQAYSADYAVARYWALYLMHCSTVSDEDKMLLAELVCQIGDDVIAAYQAGSTFANGAGQWHGYHAFATFSAFLTKDPVRLAAAQAIQSNSHSMPKWVTSDMLGQSGQWPSGDIGGSNWNGRTYDETDLGKPDWNGSGGRKGSEVPADAGYKSIALVIGTQELLPELLLVDGPGGISGLDAFLQGEGNNGRFDTTNDRAAAIAVMSRWPTWEDPERGWNSTYKMEEFHNLWMPLVYGQTTAIGGDTITAWTGVPDATEVEVITGAGAGSFNYSYTGHEQATETITRYDLAWSLDLIQFIEELNVGASGAKSGLLRSVTHYAKMRLVSASGEGKWTRTGHKVRTSDSSNRGEVTTTGTETAAAPVFTVDPLLHRPTYPGQQEPLYTVAEASLPNDTRTLYCGVGYSSGYPAPAYSFDWKKDGVSIGAPDQNFYDIDPVNDQGAVITCTITASNATGSDVHTTTGVTVGTGATKPAGTIIDTTFGPDFFLNYPYEFQNFTSDNTNGPSWNPYTTYETGEQGNIRGGKSGSNPRLILDLEDSLVDGTTYNVTVTVNKGVGDPENDNGNSYRFRIRGASTVNNVQLNETEVIADQTTEERLTFNYSFTASSPVAATFFDMTWLTTTGGGTGMDPELVSLSIVEA